MADFNKILDAGDVDGGIINVVIEIPAGSNHKIEWKRKLDALIITDTPLPTGIYMQARVIGVMKFVDDGEVDDKIVVVPADDRQTGDAIKTLADLPAQLIKQIEFHFNNYKALKKPGSTKVDHWGDIEEAKQVIRDSQQRWKQQ